MKILTAACLALAAVFVSPSFAQQITTHEDTTAGDKAEIAALSKEAGGNVYSLPHDKLMRVATLLLKYFIRDRFRNPDGVKAVITSDPRHVDAKVWRGLLYGGHKTYSGMAICARINGQNAYGGYVGDRKYLIIVSEGGSYQAFQSPYMNTITNEMTEDKTVSEYCS